MLKALIYTRVSEDRAGGRSPAEQEADARAVCEREGWEVADVVTDSTGASRYSKGNRKGWTEAKKLIAAGGIDVLVTWAASRAQRDLAAYAELRGLCEANDVRWCYQGRVYDLGKKDDRFTTGLDALLAERDSEEISTNVKRAIRANAVAGRPHGRRLYGYERVYDPTTGRLIGQQPHPTEADIVRSIYASFLAGEGLRTIARRLDQAGHATSTGARWNDWQVRRVLANPAYAAKRVHAGEVIGDADWPALVDLAAWERAQALVEARRQRSTRYTGTARLLTGVGRCGVCGGKVAAVHDRNKRKVYQCRERFEVTRDLTKLDAYVAAALLDHLRERSDPTAVDDTDATELRVRIAGERARLDAAVDQYAAGKLTATTLSKIEQRVLATIAELDAQVRTATGPLIDADVPADEEAAWEWWLALDPAVRREHVAAHIAAVVISPTRSGARAFNPDAVRIEWR